MSDRPNEPTKYARTGSDFAMNKIATAVFDPVNTALGTFSPIKPPAKRGSFMALSHNRALCQVLEDAGLAILARCLEKYCCKRVDSSVNYDMTADIADILVSLPFLAMLCVRAGAEFQKIEDARIVYRMVGWMRKSSGGMLAINEWVAKVFEPYIAPGMVGWQQHRLRVVMLGARKQQLKAPAATTATFVPPPSSSSEAAPVLVSSSGILQPRAPSAKRKCPADTSCCAPGGENVPRVGSSLSRPPLLKKRKPAKGGATDTLMKVTIRSFKNRPRF